MKRRGKGEELSKNVSQMKSYEVSKKEEEPQPLGRRDGSSGFGRSVAAPMSILQLSYQVF
jgi:hypothetical protein